uniref:BZIP domain-containing protein n=1 Tax=Strongyloides papillosus TaxID=174720 RepID=A0A0N5C9A2_STREA
MNMVFINIKNLILIFAFTIFTNSFIVNSVEENSEDLFRRSLMANSNIFSIINSFGDDSQLVVKRQAGRRRPGAAARRNSPAARRRRRRRRGRNGQIQQLRNQVQSLQAQVNALQQALSGSGGNVGGQDEYYY